MWAQVNEAEKVNGKGAKLSHDVDFSTVFSAFWSDRVMEYMFCEFLQREIKASSNLLDEMCRLSPVLLHFLVCFCFTAALTLFPLI